MEYTALKSLDAKLTQQPTFHVGAEPLKPGEANWRQELAGRLAEIGGIRNAMWRSKEVGYYVMLCQSH